MDFNLDTTYGYNIDIHKSKIIKINQIIWQQWIRLISILISYSIEKRIT